jgi:hypothetical protein
MKRNIFVLLLATVFSALFFNEMNLRAIVNAGLPLRNQQTVLTADDASYLSPALNLVEKGVYKSGFAGKGAYFLRPPGYPLFIAATRMVLGEDRMLPGIKFIQVLCYILGILCLGFLIFNWFPKKRWAFLILFFYATSGMACGFVYYTLSEGITPLLVLLFFFLLESSRSGSQRFRFGLITLAALVFGYLFITRPVFGILGLSFPFYCFNKADSLARNFSRLVVWGSMAMAPMLVWQIRNYSIAGTYVGLHPIYYPENSYSVFRPVHAACWNWVKSWGEDGAHFHGYAGTFWEAGIRGDDFSDAAQAFMAALPSRAIQLHGPKRIREVLYHWYALVQIQRPYFKADRAMPPEISVEEKGAILGFNALAAQYRSSFKFESYVGVPLRVYAKMAMHSNLSLYVFQHTWRGNILMELLRYGSFVFHFLVWILLPWALLIKMPLPRKMFLFSVILYVGYLAFVQRGIEERYTLPVLGVALLYAMLSFSRIWEWMSSRIRVHYASDS